MFFNPDVTEWGVMKPLYLYFFMFYKEIPMMFGCHGAQWEAESHFNPVEKLVVCVADFCTVCSTGNISYFILFCATVFHDDEACIRTELKISQNPSEENEQMKFYTPNIFC